MSEEHKERCRRFFAEYARKHPEDADWMMYAAIGFETALKGLHAFEQLREGMEIFREQLAAMRLPCKRESDALRYQGGYNAALADVERILMDAIGGIADG